MNNDTGEVFDGVRFDPGAAGRASSGLDALADRLTADLAAVQQALNVMPAGADEVSGRAAQTHNDVALSYLTSARAGVHEMRKFASALRLTVDRFADSETEAAAGFGRQV
ncbi:PE family protein [Nocardia sp. CA-290969]|uniref:PE family protein n=1 Tax=Nocardia sp. CA-290969 TaxID=3239986 RepID=UPI003D92DAA4